MKRRVTIAAATLVAFFGLNVVSGAEPKQEAEPRPTTSPTPRSSPSSGSKEHEKSKRAEDYSAHKPEPRPTAKAKLTEMVSHHNQGTSAQGAEARPAAVALPAYPSPSNTNAAEQGSKKKSAKPEPRPPSSPRPKPNE